MKPWTPAKATELIRRGAHWEGFSLHLTLHAKEQMHRRELIVGDILHVMKAGFVLDDGEPSTQFGLFKYRMESTTPSSGSRLVRVVLIPSADVCSAKVITVMWADEPWQSSRGS